MREIDMQRDKLMREEKIKVEMNIWLINNWAWKKTHKDDDAFRQRKSRFIHLQNEDWKKRDYDRTSSR